MDAEEAGGDGVKGAEGEAGGVHAEGALDAGAHLAGGLVGEGDG